jgi:hypothetical protein
MQQLVYITPILPASGLADDSVGCVYKGNAAEGSIHHATQARDVACCIFTRHDIEIIFFLKESVSFYSCFQKGTRTHGNIWYVCANLTNSFQLFPLFKINFVTFADFDDPIKVEVEEIAWSSLNYWVTRHPTTFNYRRNYEIYRKRFERDYGSIFQWKPWNLAWKGDSKR